MTTHDTPEAATEAGRRLHKTDHGDPCPFNSCALEPAIEDIEREAVSAAVAKARRGVPERLPSGSPQYDRERAAFNEGRAAVFALLDPRS